jgi:pyoverdine/dityrosine biosynthesis protein Dit1
LTEPQKVNIFTFVNVPPLQDRALRSRLRILEAATELFATQGFDATTVADVAKRSEHSVGLVCRYFPTREHLALAIYERLADELAASAVDLPPGSVAARFAQLMRVRITQCEANRRTLTALLGRTLDPQSPLYALGDATESTRAKVHGALGALVLGSKDAPKSETDAAQLGQLLYTVHLGLVLATLAQPSAEWAIALVEQAAALLKWVRPSLPVLRRLFASGGVSLLLDRARAPTAKDEEAVTREILTRVFRDNRVLPGVPKGLTPASAALHLPRVRAFVRVGHPIELVLPAFPAKAPNPQKVLGRLPDLGEARALERLSELLDDIEEVYSPGARLTLCSDGHVFADVVGVSDADVDRYRDALVPLIDDARISWFDLGTAFGDAAPAEMRRLLMQRYASSLEALRARSAESPGLAAQIDGIHRFLFEDELALHPELSRNHARKSTRERAYEVVRRSDAWGALVASVFPTALRLSIHPQPDPSTKIGVNLLGVKDPWLTPWHAAALVEKSGTTLIHRADAEVLGAKVVLDRGAPSHLEL